MTHKVRIVVGSNGKTPTKAHPSDAGFDLYASEDLVLPSGETLAVPTDIRIHLGAGWEGQVRSRSGLAKKGITVANSPGTIDAEYTGEVKVLLHNSTRGDHVVGKGDRVAQLVIQRVEDAAFERVDSLGDTERGNHGFGSSGG